MGGCDPGGIVDDDVSVTAEDVLEAEAGAI